MLAHENFTYKVEGYDLKTHEYILKHSVTGAEKRIHKFIFDELMKEQHKIKAP